MSGEFRVITWDERGFGETEYDGESFTYWDSARDCLGLLDHLGIEQAVLGGMSQGGFLSLRAALLSPVRVRALVLIDTQAGVEDPGRLPAYRQMQETWLQVGPVDDLANAVATLIIGDPVLSEPWIAKWKALNDESMRAPADCLFERDDITDRLGEISVPTIVFHGTADVSIEMDRAQRRSAAGSPGRGASCASRVAPTPPTSPTPTKVNGPLLDFLRSL